MSIIGRAGFEPRPNLLERIKSAMFREERDALIDLEEKFRELWRYL